MIILPFLVIIISSLGSIVIGLTFIKLLANDEPHEAQEITDAQDDNDESEDFECITYHNEKGYIVIIDIHVFCKFRILFDDMDKLFLVMVLNHLHDLGDLEDFEAVEQSDDLDNEEQTLLLLGQSDGLKWNQRDEIIKELSSEIS